MNLLFVTIVDGHLNYNYNKFAVASGIYVTFSHMAQLLTFDQSLVQRRVDAGLNETDILYV